VVASSVAGADVGEATGVAGALVAGFCGAAGRSGALAVLGLAALGLVAAGLPGILMV